jgi:hypothetical protein
MFARILASTAILILGTGVGVAQPSHQGGPDTFTCSSFQALETDARAAFLQGYALGKGAAAMQLEAAAEAGKTDVLGDDPKNDDAMAARAPAADDGPKTDLNGAAYDPETVVAACASGPDALIRELLEKVEQTNP